MTNDNPIIGIDLGTTNSLCAIFEDGEPKLIANASGQTLTPSVVAILEDDQVLVGSAAKEYQIVHPERSVATFKRWMGTDKKTTLGKKTFTPTELSSLILISLKKDAENYLEKEVKDAVISVPAYFNDQQRKVTKMAGELAGLNVMRITNEPTAAVLVYGFHERDCEKKIMVFDLGGGTFDVTIMEIFEGTLEIIASSGENFLGGEDFTRRIAAWALKEEGLNFETAELKSPLRVSRIIRECEEAKKKLANNDSVKIRIPNAEGHFHADSSKVTLDQEKFKEISNQLIDRIMAPINRTLRDSHCRLEDIADVILVGGATRMPLIKKIVEDNLKKAPLCSFNPDEVVALGMAIQAALIRADKAVEDIVMTDVCPFTLGIGIVRQFGKHIEEGYYLPIIYRNTTVPVSKEEIVSTVYYGQREMRLKVYQGEARKVKENLQLGELLVKGIPPGPAGKEVYVRFTYDVNGILDVEAFVPETKKKFHTILTNHVKGLSEQGIKRALKNMQKIKFYPRDDIRNQNLLRFGERIIGEINPYEREELEQALDFFQAAMNSGDRQKFKAARENLIMLLSRLGFEYEEENRS